VAAPWKRCHSLWKTAHSRRFRIAEPAVDLKAGIAVAQLAGMVEKTPVSMLRWVFGRDEAAITCEVDFTEGHGYDVTVVPHWNISASVIEHFDSALKAMGRHAELASKLRDEGWTLLGSITQWSQSAA
jgi:hypothetical protein